MIAAEMVLIHHGRTRYWRQKSGTEALSALLSQALVNALHAMHGILNTVYALEVVSLPSCRVVNSILQYRQRVRDCL